MPQSTTQGTNCLHSRHVKGTNWRDQAGHIRMYVCMYARGPIRTTTSKGIFHGMTTKRGARLRARPNNCI